MVRMLKYPMLVLAVCLIAATLARGEGDNNEQKEAGKAIVAVFTLDRPLLEKPRGEEFRLFSPIERTALRTWWSEWERPRATRT